jgi:hypothetical protein
MQFTARCYRPSNEALDRGLPSLRTWGTFAAKDSRTGRTSMPPYASLGYYPLGPAPPLHVRQDVVLRRISYDAHSGEFVVVIAE